MEQLSPNQVDLYMEIRRLKCQLEVARRKASYWQNFSNGLARENRRFAEEIQELVGSLENLSNKVLAQGVLAA